MNHQWFHPAWGVLLVLSLILYPIRPASSQPKGEKIEVSADKLTVEEAGNVIRAEGNVVVKRGETILKAQEVKVSKKNQEVEARGQVSITDPEWKMKAKSLRMNMQDETGEIQEGEIFIEKGHLSLTGRRFEKFTGQAYHIDDGSFTTCLCESGTPTWKITAKEIGMSQEGDGFVRGGTFHIMDVPVLYLPYAFFPMRSERQSGFLFPKFGFSSREGFRYRQPYFWAISKSADATLEADVETRARVGATGEFRKVFSRSSSMYLHGSYFNEALRDNAEDDIEDRTIADQSIPQDRWSAIANHRSTHDMGWVTYSDIFAFSDDLFSRELVDRFDLDAARERDIRSIRYARSKVGIFNSSGDMHLRGEWDAYQDFIQEDDRTFYKIPNLSFWGRRELGSPFELSWRAEGVNYMRKEGADGLRLDLRPQLTLPFRLTPYLFGSLGAAPRETLYYLHRTDRANGRFDRSQTRELVELTGNIGTSVGSVFAWNGPVLKKIRHVVEPQVNYLFIPGTNQSDIPIMDGTDRINRRNLLTFSLVNRFLGKFIGEAPEGASDQEVELLTPSAQGEIREMARLGLALSYDIDKERKRGDSLSDLDIDLRLTPADYLTLDAFTGLNPGPWQFSQAGAQLSLIDPRPLMHRVLDRDFNKPNALSVGYRFIRRDLLAPLAENANLTTLPDERLSSRNVVEELGVHSLVHLSDHFLLLYDSSYDAREGRFTGNRGGIKFLSLCECWTASFTVNRTTNPDKMSFKFGFSLLGLGSSN